MTSPFINIIHSLEITENPITFWQRWKNRRCKKQLKTQYLQRFIVLTFLFALFKFFPIKWDFILVSQYLKLAYFSNPYKMRSHCIQAFGRCQKRRFKFKIFYTSRKKLCNNDVESYYKELEVLRPLCGCFTWHYHSSSGLQWKIWVILTVYIRIHSGRPN